jgi:predicted amino acid racemase
MGGALTKSSPARRFPSFLRLGSDATRVSIELLNVSAHKITKIFQKFKETHRLMNKLGFAFISTSRHTNFRTLARVLLYCHVVHVSSCSLVLVSRYKRVVVRMQLI